MKKIAFLFLMLITFSSFAATDENVMKIANNICSKDNECVNIIALELDKSYYDGINAKQKAETLQASITKKENSLSNLCVKAPDRNLCDYYKHELINEFYLGYTEK